MDANEIAALVDDIEDRVERLRALYDQYFMGIERLEPLILRKDVDRRIWQLRREPIRNTALRFKLQTIVQRYNTYQQYWQRICREIESGTYYRDVSRAAARFGEVALTAMGRKRQQMFQKGAARRAERASVRAESGEPDAPTAETNADPPAAAVVAAMDPEVAKAVRPRPSPAVPAEPAEPPEPALGLDLESLADLAPLAEQLIDTLERGRGPERESTTATMGGAPEDRRSEALGAVSVGAAAPLRKVGVAPAPPRSTPDRDDLSPTRLRELYGAYVEARRRCHESTAAITLERLSANLRQTASTLRAKHPGRHVAFEVVIKNGSAVLKAVVKT